MRAFRAIAYRGQLEACVHSAFELRFGLRYERWFEVRHERWVGLRHERWGWGEGEAYLRRAEATF